MKPQYKLSYKRALTNKKSSILTLSSLVITFLGVIVLSLFINYEFSYNKQYSKDIYHLKTRMYQDALPLTILDEIQGKFAGIITSTVIDQKSEDVSLPDNTYGECIPQLKVIYTDNNFFKIFDYQLKGGKKDNISLILRQALVTPETAHKLFGNNNPIGEIIIINQIPHTISGIINNSNKRSTIQFDAVCSISEKLESARKNKSAAWGYSAFLQLDKNTNIEDLETKINNSLKDTQPWSSLMEVNGSSNLLYLNNFQNIHFDTSNMMFESSNPIISYVLFFLLLLVIVMGLVNYINFLSEQIPLQAKCSSLLGVFGASKNNIRISIIMESVITCLLALVVALIVHSFIFPVIHLELDIKGLQLSNRLLFIVYFIIGVIIFAIIGAFWPAKQITNFELSQSIKGKHAVKQKTHLTRNLLLTIQFSVAIILSISALTIDKQLNYWYNYNTGIDTENVVQVRMSSKLKKHKNAFAEQLLLSPSIIDYTFADQSPTKITNGVGTGINDKFINFKKWSVSENFLPFFNITIADGRSFQTNNNADFGKILINKKALAEIDWTDSFQGKIISTGDTPDGEIIGVIDNIQINSLHSATGPLQIYLSDDSYTYEYIFLKLATDNFLSIIKNINEVAEQFDSTIPLEIEIVNDELNKLYNQEKRMGKFIKMVTLWCILIAIIGMIGMVLFITQHRIKEVSIRKINGASIWQILVLLNKRFIYIVGIAFIIACPIAYILINYWLNNFTYTIEINIAIFFITGLVSILASIIIVALQTISFAHRNPILSLKYE